jgi:hypothetical protein
MGGLRKVLPAASDVWYLPSILACRNEERLIPSPVSSSSDDELSSESLRDGGWNKHELSDVHNTHKPV